MDEAERNMYLLWGKLDTFWGRFEKARKLVDEFIGVVKKPYISLSFGKDSLVMAHLILSRYPEIPVIYVNCGEFDEWPDTERVKGDFLRLFPNIEFIELIGPSIWNYYQQVGLYIQDEEDNREARKAQRKYAQSLGKVINLEVIKRGFDGAFIGMRAEESDLRNFLFAKRGYLYYAETRRQWVCCPLYRWTGRDIWAYIVAHNLPYNELYDLAPEGRERARNGAMFGTRSARYGRLVFLKKMYPEWFNRFAAEFPGVRGYV